MLGSRPHADTHSVHRRAPFPGAPHPHEDRHSAQQHTKKRISAEDALELWRAYKATGDIAARNRLVMTYAPLVKYIVFKKVRELPARCEVEDFISCGLEALIASIDRYDPEKGATLEQFAWTRIHGAVLDELRRQDWAPRSLRRWERDIHKAREQFTALHGRRPDARGARRDARHLPRRAAPPPGRHRRLRRHLAQHARDLRRRDDRRAHRHARRRRRPARPRAGRRPPRPARTSSAAPSSCCPAASARSPSCSTSRTSRCARSATSSACPRAASARSTRSSSAPCASSSTRTRCSSPPSAELRPGSSSLAPNGRSRRSDDLRDRPTDPRRRRTGGARSVVVPCDRAHGTRRARARGRRRGRDAREPAPARCWPRWSARATA